LRRAGGRNYRPAPGSPALQTFFSSLQVSFLSQVVSCNESTGISYSGFRGAWPCPRTMPRVTSAAVPQNRDKERQGRLANRPYTKFEGGRCRQRAISVKYCFAA